MASFRDQLAGFKGLRASLEKKEQKDAAMERKNEAARLASLRLGQRLVKAGRFIRNSILLKRSEASGGCIKKRRMGLLILIIDSLPFEPLWREWMQRQNGATEVKVWIHAKHPDKVTSPWVLEKLIPRSFCPAWGSVDITRAELELLRVAVEDASDIQLFLFASESCIPIQPLDTAVKSLFPVETSGTSSRPQSWLHFTDKPNNGYSNQQQFEPLVKAGLPSTCIWKADQWVALTRPHAEAVLALPKAFGEDLWPMFRAASASDEMYFPTCLALLGEIGPSGPKVVTEDAASSCLGSVDGSKKEGGLEKESTLTKSTTGTGLGIEESMPPRAGEGVVNAGGKEQQQSVLRRRLTYCCWGDSPKSPETYEGLPSHVLERGIREGSLLGRKFKAGTVKLEEWLAHMRAMEGKGDEGFHVQGVGKDSGNAGQDAVGRQAKKRRREEGGPTGPQGDA